MGHLLSDVRTNPRIEFIRYFVRILYCLYSECTVHTKLDQAYRCRTDLISFTYITPDVV